MKRIFIEKYGTYVYYFMQDDENKTFGAYSKPKDMFDHMVRKNNIQLVDLSRTEITLLAEKAFYDGYSFHGMMYNADKHKIII